jgi:hypothetical protein
MNQKKHDEQYGNYTVQMVLGGPKSSLCHAAMAQAKQINMTLCEYIRYLVKHKQNILV